MDSPSKKQNAPVQVAFGKSLPVDKKEEVTKEPFEHPWESTDSKIPYRLQKDALFYTIENQKARRMLSKHRMMKAKIDSIWFSLPKDNMGCFSKKDYMETFMRVGLILNKDLSMEDNLAIVEKDWKRDSKGRDSLTQEMFHKAAFEMADMWVPSININAYVEFLDIVLSKE